VQPLLNPIRPKHGHSKEKAARLNPINFLHPFTQLAAGNADFNGVFFFVRE
jgi:hypothetical protein